MTDREEYMEAHNDDGRHDDDEAICPECGAVIESEQGGVWYCVDDECGYVYDPDWRKNIG